MELVKLGHVSLITPDLETSAAFFHDVVGLEEVARSGDSIYMRAWGDWDHHSLVLTAGKRSLVDHVSFRASSPEDIGEFAKEIAGSGTEVTEVPAGTEPGQGDAIRFDLESGHTFEIYYDMDRPASKEGERSRLKTRPGKAFARGVSPRRIDHFNINVPDPARLHAWMGDHLGFKMRERLTMDGAVVGGWMSVSNLMHDSAVMLDPLGRQEMFHHVAFYTDNWNDVLRGAEVLREAGVEIECGPGKHGGSEGFFLYFKDPGSGHRVELYSGGYLIFDPDWVPIEWSAEELDHFMVWYGPKLPDDFLTDCTGPAATPLVAQPA
jgi:catechol 2,3-dioxygenase